MRRFVSPVRYMTAAAVVLAGSFASLPAFAASMAGNFDMTADEALGGIAQHVARGDLDTALTVTNLLRYNCIDGVQVQDLAIDIAQLEQLISAQDVDTLMALATQPEQSFITGSRFVRCDAEADLSGDNTPDVAESTPSEPPPPPPPPEEEPPPEAPE